MSSGRVAVYGGRGALGSVLLAHFKAKNYWTLSIDLAPNEAADVNVVVMKEDASWTDQEKRILNEVSLALGGQKLDAILAVAGGWAGGNAASAKLVANANAMWQQSVWSSLIATRLAALHLKQGGLLQLTGAAAALDGTPGMIGYGIAKAAVHQLTRTLGDGEKAGLPKDATVVALLPVTLDTPQNRKWMPNADFSKSVVLPNTQVPFWTLTLMDVDSKARVLFWTSASKDYGTS